MNKTMFLRRFLRNPHQVGAFCPSSETLCRTIVSRIGVDSAKVLVELGPGTGVITREIVERMPNQAKLMAIELDKTLSLHLAAKFPGVIICNDSAIRMPDLLNEHSLGKADAVISGLPWAIFPPGLQHDILTAIHESLAGGGSFATFAYLQGLMLPAGQRFRKMLNEVFDTVETSPVIWKNLPPAFIYRCRKEA